MQELGACGQGLAMENYHRERVADCNCASYCPPSVIPNVDALVLGATGLKPLFPNPYCDALARSASSCTETVVADLGSLEAAVVVRGGRAQTAGGFVISLAKTR